MLRRRTVDFYQIFKSQNCELVLSHYENRNLPSAARSVGKFRHYTTHEVTQLNRVISFLPDGLNLNRSETQI